MPDNHIVRVKVWGDFACFTRPEMKVERMSYPIMTPSAARGVLDAILFKKKTDAKTQSLVPAFNWHVRRITALRHAKASGRANCEFISIRRNEIQGKIAPGAVIRWMKNPDEFEPYLVDSAGRESAGGQNRTQRNTIALRDVAYLIEASINMAEYSQTDPPVKYREMFERRVAKGQCFHRPYLGCREFAADFAAADGTEQPLADWNEELGLMLYDIRYAADGQHVPGFFKARIASGVLHCDTDGRGPGGEEPVSILGWGEGVSP